jgi:hypothetical protein
MADFKIVFPGGYNVNDDNNDNIDLNIILPNGLVFFSTFFTISNIKTLIVKDNEVYFWATDMVIVKNLTKETIKSTVHRMINDGYLELACSKIGEIHDVFPNFKSYSDIICNI